jgi:CRISPR/Cas system-associated exonuclease Cas4 (RecB family)
MPDEVPVSVCLLHAKKDLFRDCNWNHALLSMMVEKPDERISATRLMQCPRQIALKRRFEYTLDPAVEYLKVRGTIFHAGLEQLFGENNELELERTLPGPEPVRIQGRLDRLDGGAVGDWKTKKYINKAFQPLPDHIMQLSVYAWLAEPLMGRVQHGELMYLDMSKPARFVVKLRGVDEVEDWLRERVPVLLAAYDEAAELAPALPGRDDKKHPEHWKCKSCPVLQLCRDVVA